MRNKRLGQNKEKDKAEAYNDKPLICTMCQAVYRNGRWAWGEVPVNAHEIICPACQRYEENQPAGIIDIRGILYKNHKDQILNLITNAEKSINLSHPMERIMSIHDKRGHTVITTTGTLLAKEIADILKQSFNGKAEYNYHESDNTLDVVLKY